MTAYALQRGGHHVIVAADGTQALQRWEAEQPDVVVLDVGLPKMSGFDVCQTIRRSSATPVILLTALSDEESIIRGFRAGADDYVTKPFSPRVLAARIQAVRGRIGDSAEAQREFTVGSLSVDTESHEVHKSDGTMVRLTPIEFRLLQVLTLNAGRVVSNGRLVDYAWACNGGDTSLLKTHISHIRRKLDFGTGCDIYAIPSVGYRLVTERSRSAT